MSVIASLTISPASFMTAARSTTTSSLISPLTSSAISGLITSFTTLLTIAVNAAPDDDRDR